MIIMLFGCPLRYLVPCAQRVMCVYETAALPRLGLMTLCRLTLPQGCIGGAYTCLCQAN